MGQYFRSIRIDKNIVHVRAKDMVLQYTDDISTAQPFISQDTTLILQGFFQLHGEHMKPVEHNNFFYLERINPSKIIQA